MKTLSEIIDELVVLVFNKHKVNVDTITIDDFDLDRVYINNNAYLLRMWNIYDSGDVEYTLYKMVNNSALNRGAGRVLVNKRFVRLLQEYVEQRYFEYEKRTNNKE